LFQKKFSRKDFDLIGGAHPVRHPFVGVQHVEPLQMNGGAPTAASGDACVETDCGCRDALQCVSTSAIRLHISAPADRNSHSVFPTEHPRMTATAHISVMCKDAFHPSPPSVLRRTRDNGSRCKDAFHPSPPSPRLRINIRAFVRNIIVPQKYKIILCK